MKKALITGITGQDGSYLAELLLIKGYEVHGLVRRSSGFNFQKIDHIYLLPEYRDKKLILHYGDLSDGSSIARLIEKVKPDEIYNLAAQSHVRISFDIPDYTADVTGIGTLRLLDAIRDSGINTRFYQASSSEMFGLVQEIPQRETTPFYPRSPYGCAKVYAYWITRNYRESYNIFASNGILFNHESPRRGENFVTRKITRNLARIALGLETSISMGNLDSKRDWGFAKDYVEAMWMMLQHHVPDDFIIATNQTHSVREFIEESCRLLGIPLEWKGKGVKERGINSKTGKTIITINPVYFRPTEVDLLLGDYTKAKQAFGWKPTTTFKDLVRIMLEADLATEAKTAGIKKIPQLLKKNRPYG